MPDGTTHRDHLVAVEARGVDTGELVPPPIPADCDQVLETFWALRRSAGSNGTAPNTISFTELEAWQAMYGVRLQPMEVDLILQMDGAAIAEINKKAN